MIIAFTLLEYYIYHKESWALAVDAAAWMPVSPSRYIFIGAGPSLCIEFCFCEATHADE